MRRSLGKWLVMGVLLGVSRLLGAEDVDWGDFFRKVWQGSLHGREVAWAQVASRARYRAEEGQWLPVIALGTETAIPRQLSATSLGGYETLTLSPSGGVVLRVPGGGSARFTAQMEPSWPTWTPHSKPEWSPSFSFDGAFPLVRRSTRELARLGYDTEVHELALVVLHGWLVMVQAAADVDLGRLAVAIRRAKEAVALQKQDETEQLKAVGRATEARRVADQGQTLQARWDRVEAEAALSEAQASWFRLWERDLPPVDEVALLSWARTLRSGVEELEVESQRLRAAKEVLQLEDQGASLAPSLSWGLTVARPLGRSAQISMQFGLAMTTDFLVVGPEVGAARRAALARGAVLVEQANRALVQRTLRREARVGDFRVGRASVVSHLAEARSVRDALWERVQKHESLPSEALEAEVVVAEMVFLERRLTWEVVLESGFR